MTALEIKPRWSDKTARFKGTVAAGEVVAVTVKGAADWINEDALRLRIVNERGDTVAQFPVPDEVYDAETMPANTWGTAGDENEDATCQLSLNTDQMRRCVPRGTRMLLFVLDDPTQGNGILYFKDLCEVTHWPDRTGEDSPAPIDLGNYRNFLREAQDAMDDAADRVEAAETQIAASANDAAAAVTAASQAQIAAQGAASAIPAHVEAAIDNADIPGVVASEVEDQLEYKQDSLTDEQMAAVDSGITEEILGAIQGGIEDLQSGKADASTVTAALALKANASDMETALANKAGNSALSAEVAARASADATLNAKITTLIGTDDNMSARSIAQQEVAKIVASADADFDTLKEVADWIKSDTTGAAKMQSDISDLKSGKVDKVTGKGLSTEDYTTAEKQKLAGIEASANNYTLPTAGASTLGGVKVGANLSIDANGVLSATGGSSVTVDDALSDTSENPVQNKVVTAALAEKVSNEEKGFTAWVVSPPLPEGWTIEWYDDGEGTAGWKPKSPDGFNGIAKGDATSTSLSWADEEWGNPLYNYAISATRTYAPLVTQADLAGKENASNKVTALSAQSTDAQYPSAKCVYDGLAKIPYDLPSTAITPTPGAPFVLAACFPIKYTDGGSTVTIAATDAGDLDVDESETPGMAYEVSHNGTTLFGVSSNGFLYVLLDMSVTFGDPATTPSEGETQVLCFTPTYALADRTMNRVTLTSPLPENGIALAFPAPTDGKVRDFLVRLEIPAGDAPQIAYPEGVTFENADGEFPEIAADENAACATLLMFTETKAATTGAGATPACFLVKGEKLTSIPTTAGGAS